MDQIKRRGPQYFVLVLIIMASLILVIYFKPKPSIIKKEVVAKSKKAPKKSFKTGSPLMKKEVIPKSIDSAKLVKIDNISIKDAMKKEMDQAPKQTESYFEALLKTYELAKSTPRNDVVIRYYKKNEDGNMINSLRKLGFYIHERPTAKDLQGLYTNTIYYGDSVRQEDILIVAYQLKESGMKLQAVEHSRFGDDWKSHSIELGTDTTMLKAPELSLMEIKDIIENNPYLKTHL